MQSDALTGVAEVDRVIRGLDQLDDLPIEQHAVFFESAHDALRAALDAPHTRMPRPDLNSSDDVAVGHDRPELTTEQDA